MVSEDDTMISTRILGSLTYREGHAFVDGFYCGVNNINTTKYLKEKHYWRTGWLCGDLYDFLFPVLFFSFNTSHFTETFK